MYKILHITSGRYLQSRFCIYTDLILSHVWKRYSVLSLTDGFPVTFHFKWSANRFLKSMFNGNHNCSKEILLMTQSQLIEFEIVKD